MYYLMLCASALLLALDFALNKLYQQKAGTSIRAGLGFNALLGGICTLLFFTLGVFSVKVTWYSLLMAAGMATLVMIYNLIGFRIMKMGSMAIYTLFLMTGGMVVPYVWGLAFWDEPFSLLRLLGLLLIIVAVALSNVSKKKIGALQILMCLAVFVINGFTSVISKAHQIELNFETVDLITFIMLFNACKFVLAGIAYLIVRCGKKEHTETNGEKTKISGILPIIFGSAILSGGAFVLQLLSASKLPATVLFPIQTGGTMILSSLAGVAFFREKLSKSIVIGLSICFVGTLLFL